MMSVGGSDFHDRASADAAMHRLAKERQRLESFRAAAAVDSPDNRWFVVQCAPRRDASVRDAMVHYGIECWRPVKSTRGRGGRKGHAKTVVSVFEGYLFVRVPVTPEAYLGLLSIEHVMGIVGGDSGPLPVGNQEVKAVSDGINAGVFDDYSIHGRWLPKAGDALQVKVNGVTFESVVTDVYTRRKAARVLAWMFGGEREVIVGLDAFNISA